MLTNYFKVAVKVLLRRKVYTFVSLFGIAFTLLILNLVVALMDHALSPVQPESRLSRILTIEDAKKFGDSASSSSSAGFKLLDEYARDLPGVEAFSVATQAENVAAYVDGEKVQPRMRRTDAVLWEILDYVFVEGAPYTHDDVANGSFYAVINETTRQRFFGEQNGVGQSIRLNDQTFTVVGVVQDVPVIRNLAFSEVWVPLTTAKSTSYRSELLGNMTGVLLAGSRADFPAIREELASRLSRAQMPDPETHHTLVSGAYTRYEHIAREFFGKNDATEPVKTGRLTLMLSLLALLFMALPALNLINLSLSRILERASEIGVRKAFGASSITLIGQFLVESVILTLIGSFFGLVLSGLALALIGNADLIPYADMSLNLKVFLYGIGLALVFAIVSGAYPAWRMSRLHPVEALHGRSA
jgi:putative ABC transport system permease protein